MSGPDVSRPLETGSHPMTRRQFGIRSMFALAALPAASALLSACGDEPAGGAGGGGGGGGGGAVTWASFGGAYNEALQSGFVDPFTKQTGIKVKLASNTSLATLKQQVASNAVQWDIAELTGSEYEIAVAQGIPLEALDLDIIDTANVPDYAVKEFGVKYAFFTQVMAWDNKAVTEPPADWSEFLDPKRFSVKRSMYETLSDSSLLEFALLADGVAMADLYPLDVDRALASLERLGAEDILWYESNQEVIQQLQSGESGLGMPFTGRVRLANESGADLGYTTNQAGVTGDYLVVPKGAPNAEKAMELINFICNDAEAAAEFMRTTYYGVSNLKAIDLLPADIAAEIPTSPALQGKVFMKDDAWWAENLDQVTQQFMAWQVSHQ